MSRGFLLSFIVLGLVLAILFAAFPVWDLEVAQYFFDPKRARFPLSISYEWNLIRQAAKALPIARGRRLRAAAEARVAGAEDGGRPVSRALSARLVPDRPGVTSNLLLKENWGRLRPNGIQQFAGTADFQPWWRPSGACKRNCAFVSGEASQAFWTIAPATLAPPQMRPLALGGAVIFGTAVGSLRVVLGRHFVSDIVFAGLITIAIVFALYRLLLDLLRRN